MTQTAAASPSVAGRGALHLGARCGRARARQRLPGRLGQPGADGDLWGRWVGGTASGRAELRSLPHGLSLTLAQLSHLPLPQPDPLAGGSVSAHRPCALGSWRSLGACTGGWGSDRGGGAVLELLLQHERLRLGLLQPVNVRLIVPFCQHPSGWSLSFSLLCAAPLRSSSSSLPSPGPCQLNALFFFHSHLISQPLPCVCFIHFSSSSF